MIPLCLIKKAVKVIEKDSTNDWGFDGERSTTYIFPNKYKYKTGTIYSDLSGGTGSIEEFSTNRNKKINEAEFLKATKQRRKS
jgi:hypothetical protein